MRNLMKPALIAAVMAITCTVQIQAGEYERLVERYEAAETALKRGDTETALKIYKMMVREGDPVAAYQIGQMYAGGLGVKINWVEAVYWYRISAEAGFDTAQLMLGGLYAIGNRNNKTRASDSLWGLQSHSVGRGSYRRV